MKFSLSFTFAFLLIGGGMYSQTNTFPSNGNTGVGTTNPGEKLEVVGNLKVTGDAVIGGNTRLKSNVVIEGPLKLKPFVLNYQAPDRLLGVNAMGVVTVNPSIDRLNIRRIVPPAGDSLIRFGDSTIYLNTASNTLTYTSSTFNPLVKGFSIGNGTSTAFGVNSLAFGYNLRTGSGANNAIVIGSGGGSSLVNNIPNSLMIGFNSNIPTLMVSSASGNNTSGFVGIGTSTPNAPLQIGNNSYKVAIGSLFALSTMDYAWSYFGFNVFRTGNQWGLDGDGAHNGGSIIYTTTSGQIYFASVPSSGGNAQLISDQTMSSGNVRLTIAPYGSVGIGTKSPDPLYLLSVNGKIRAKSIRVETGWSDFVFDHDYQLLPVYELEGFIKQYKHLPDIPSEDQVKLNGIDLGEMNAKLLQKIEELTLYIIALKKETDALQLQINDLNSK